MPLENFQACKGAGIELAKIIKSKHTKRSLFHKQRAEELFSKIQVDTVRGLHCLARPLGQLLLKETELDPEAVVLLLRRIYALFEETAVGLLKRPTVLDGLPIELVSNESTSQLLAILHLEHDLRTNEHKMSGHA